MLKTPKTVKGRVASAALVAGLGLAAVLAAPGTSFAQEDTTTSTVDDTETTTADDVTDVTTDTAKDESGEDTEDTRSDRPARVDDECEPVESEDGSSTTG